MSFKVIGYHAITHTPTEYHNYQTRVRAEEMAKDLARMGIDGEIHQCCPSKNGPHWAKISEWHWNE